jgi:VanZ family protein
LDDIWFDKWVHIGLFSLLCFIACWVWNGCTKRFFALLFCAAAAYGFLIEVIQDQYIPNRSMDLGDWIADMIGSAIGLLVWKWKRRGYIKKIDPCGNRGRNQN